MDKNCLSYNAVGAPGYFIWILDSGATPDSAVDYGYPVDVEYGTPDVHYVKLFSILPPNCRSNFADSMMEIDTEVYIEPGPWDIVDAIGYKTDISASPNPTDGIIAFHDPDFIESLQIVNIVGITLIDLGRISSNDVSVDVHGLPPGIYYSIIHSGAGAKALRFVVM